MGRRQIAVVDPGPDDPLHIEAVARTARSATTVVVLLTHAHLDHAGAASGLAQALGAQHLGAGPVDRVLREGESVDTDAGALVAVATPGHVREHLSFLWPARQALFAGDLVLGRGHTTMVAGYPGCIKDYLASLTRVRALRLRRIYPAHGPHIDDVQERLAAFEAHRRKRIEQVEQALAENPTLSRATLLVRVYGDRLPSGLESAARESIDAILDHLGEVGRS